MTEPEYINIETASEIVRTYDSFRIGDFLKEYEALVRKHRVCVDSVDDLIIKSRTIEEIPFDINDKFGPSVPLTDEYIDDYMRRVRND